MLACEAVVRPDGPPRLEGPALGLLDLAALDEQLREGTLRLAERAAILQGREDADRLAEAPLGQPEITAVQGDPGQTLNRARAPSRRPPRRSPAAFEKRLLGHVQPPAGLVHPAPRDERPSSSATWLLLASASSSERAASSSPRSTSSRASAEPASEPVAAASRSTSPRLVRDRQRAVEVQIEVVQLAEPPADVGPLFERVESRLWAGVLEQRQRLLGETMPARQVGVAEQRDVGQRGDRAALDRAIARLRCGRANGLHLDGHDRQVVGRLGRARGQEPPLECAAEPPPTA